MKKVEYSIIINATPEKVWDVITGKGSYELWTAPFAEGSTAQTDWKKGSKAIFSDGKGNGMVSEIAESIPGKFLSIHHLGEVKDGVEDTTTYEGEQWGDALENYTLKVVNSNQTLWLVEMDMNEDYLEYMNSTWPLALQKAKELAEK
ncbi:ATPase [Pedobacter lusitanus]|uniref:ATPase n=1 Tax=Pedobacter lusitanus TaxID=1503925 RepID=A0A0D0F7I5_9SPHI|nr:SRPBCC domain-containing protein [Pedobacter lusitanus]KIO77613.1 ATPase [Pedobacter lusitanus]